MEIKSSSAIKQRAKDLRHAPTPAENILWQHLRGRKLCGCKFRRQHPLGRFILDFYCIEQRLVIEVDGPIHDHQVEYDLERTHILEALGCRVLRFKNEDVELNLQSVLERIGRELR